MPDYVSSDTATLDVIDSDWNRELLWGDQVRVLDSSENKKMIEARGLTGWIDESDLGGEPLLELYFIDVGQGDGLLIVTPDRRHIVIDGGHKREQLPTGKNAADFIDWKFHEEYGKDRIKIDAAIASHCDTDHYGGLHNLLQAGESPELDSEGISIEKFYHAGLSRWTVTPDAERSLGRTVQHDGRTFLTDLLEGRNSAIRALDGDYPQLQGWWANFIESMTEAETKDGQNTPFERISQKTGVLDGFDGEDEDEVRIAVLAPLEDQIDDQPVLEHFDEESSLSTNGHSVVLRLEYGSSRILLTGDLNRHAHRRLLSAYENPAATFECDVAKACHHGSADISFEFLEATRPSATIVSSGDNENYNHPRPNVLSAYALSGKKTIEDDMVQTPLLYSTELARSVKYGHPTAVRSSETGEYRDFSDLLVEYETRYAGDLEDDEGEILLPKASLVTDLVYGLVNVRTDGDRVLCATMDEKDGSWNMEVFNARFTE